MVSFGFDSFQRYLNQEIFIKKEIINQNFIDPPGIFNKTFIMNNVEISLVQIQRLNY